MATEGITRADVDAAMDHLGIYNPKPEIPLEVTVSGHEIVGISRRIQELQFRVLKLELAQAHDS
jgi:hypothetical protein